MRLRKNRTPKKRETEDSIGETSLKKQKLKDDDTHGRRPGRRPDRGNSSLQTTRGGLHQQSIKRFQRRRSRQSFFNTRQQRNRYGYSQGRKSNRRSVNRK